MAGSRQAPDRSNQRARTRRAILDAAVAMLREGRQPSVAEAAAAVGVHRATAHRYFPTPRSLLAEAALTLGEPDPEEIYRGVAPDDPLALMDAGVRAVSAYMVREEALFRTIVLWDNGPAHNGDPLRTYLTTPDLHLRLVRLPAYSPDFNADEAIWGWVRAEVTANTCFGTRAKVREKVGEFFRRLPNRADEVKRRCRTILQTRADAFTSAVQIILRQSSHVDPTLALV